MSNLSEVAKAVRECVEAELAKAPQGWKADTYDVVCRMLGCDEGTMEYAVKRLMAQAAPSSRVAELEAEVAALTAQRDAYKNDLAHEMEGNGNLRHLFGARGDETFYGFVSRLAEGEKRAIARAEKAERERDEANVRADTAWWKAQTYDRACAKLNCHGDLDRRVAAIVKAEAALSAPPAPGLEALRAEVVDAQAELHAAAGGRSAYRTYAARCKALLAAKRAAKGV